MQAHPTSLQPVTVVSGHKLEYRNLMELCQGGPEVGQLYIDDRRISGRSRFGGPFVCLERRVYVPLYRRSLFSSGFVLVEIDLESLHVMEVSGCYPLIYLDKLSGNRLLFYTDLEQKHVETVMI